MTQNPTFSLASKYANTGDFNSNMSDLLLNTSDLSEEQLQKVDFTPEKLYTPNDRALLPMGHDILTRYLDARPNWMFIKMFEGFWAGDERKEGLKTARL